MRDGLEVPVFDDDRVFADALFLHNHPGWSPRDLADAPEELIETMNVITAAVATARDKEARRSRGPSRAAMLASQSRLGR